jgi:hypothetical protein
MENGGSNWYARPYTLMLFVKMLALCDMQSTNRRQGLISTSTDDQGREIIPVLLTACLRQSATQDAG